MGDYMRKPWIAKPIYRKIRLCSTSQSIIFGYAAQGQTRPQIQKFGFAIKGTLVDFAFSDGQYADVYFMARLRR